METESVYSMISDLTHTSAITVATDQLGITVFYSYLEQNIE